MRKDFAIADSIKTISFFKNIRFICSKISCYRLYNIITITSNSI